MGASCASCNFKTQTDLPSGDDQTASRNSTQCLTASDPNVQTRLLPRQSYNSAGTNLREDNIDLKQKKQGNQNTHSKEIMPSALSTLSRVSEMIDRDKPDTRSATQKPTLVGNNTHGLNGTSENSQCFENQQVIHTLESSINFFPLRSEVFGTNTIEQELLFGKPKTPQRMHSEPSVGRLNILCTKSSPTPRRNIKVSYSNPPTRRQSVSDIQLEMARNPMQFSTRSKTPPPSPRRTTMSKLLFSFAINKKEHRKVGSQDISKDKRTIAGDEVEKMDFRRLSSSTGMESMTDSTSCVQIRRKSVR